MFEVNSPSAPGQDAPAAHPILKFEPAVPQRGSKNLSPAMLLSAFFGTFYLPHLRAKQTAERTIDLYKQLVRYWIRLTGDPPLNEIDDSLVATFMLKLQELPGTIGERITANTVNKHCTHLRAILNAAGPRGGRIRHGQNLIFEVPYVPRLKAAAVEVEKVYTLEQLAKLIEFTRFLPKNKYIPRIPAERWMRSLLILLYNCGCRIGCALELRWAWLREKNGITYFDVPAWASHSKGGKAAIKVIVNRFAKGVLEVMGMARDANDPDAKIFPRTVKNADQFVQKLMKRILKKAGFPKTQHYGFQGIRKLANTEMCLINPHVAPAFLGHASQSINLVHYTHQRVLLDATEKLPQPKWSAGQMDLF